MQYQIIKLPEWLLSIRFTVKIDVFPFDSGQRKEEKKLKLDHFLRICKHKKMERAISELFAFGAGEGGKGLSGRPN